MSLRGRGSAELLTRTVAARRLPERLSAACGKVEPSLVSLMPEAAAFVLAAHVDDAQVESRGGGPARASLIKRYARAEKRKRREGGKRQRARDLRAAEPSTPEERAVCTAVANQMLSVVGDEGVRREAAAAAAAARQRGKVGSKRGGRQIKQQQQQQQRQQQRQERQHEAEQAMREAAWQVGLGACLQFRLYRLGQRARALKEQRASLEQAAAEWLEGQEGGTLFLGDGHLRVVVARGGAGKALGAGENGKGRARMRKRRRRKRMTGQSFGEALCEFLLGAVAGRKREGRAMSTGAIRAFVEGVRREMVNVEQ
jgi:hypothetical protein